MGAALVPISEEGFDGLRAWRIGAPDGSTALVAERGATLLSWRPLGGAEVVDGYENAGEVEAAVSGRSLVMAPWAGTLRDCQYVHEGTRYDVASLTRGDPARSLAYGVDFVRREAGDALHLQTDLPATDGYPWPMRVSVLFALEAGAGRLAHLSATIGVENLGDSTAPVSLGWMPFVRLPGRSGISNLSVRVPARTRVMADARGVPFNGDAAYGGIQTPEQIDYIGTTRLDQSYTDLVPDENGVVVTTVTDPVSGVRVSLTQEPSEAPVVRVSTGDSFERGPRGSIGLAPCSALPNAFNRADEAARLSLRPGQTRSLTSTLTYEA